MIYKKVKIDSEVIKLCAEENAEIPVWVNGEYSFGLPLVHNGELTITLTPAGLAALEEEIELTSRYVPEIEKVEFQEN